MRKQTITKKYLINRLRSHLEEYLYTPITVRKIAEICKDFYTTDLFAIFEYAKL